MLSLLYTARASGPRTSASGVGTSERTLAVRPFAFVVRLREMGGNAGLDTLLVGDAKLERFKLAPVQQGVLPTNGVCWLIIYGSGNAVDSIPSRATP